MFFPRPLDALPFSPPSRLIFSVSVALSPKKPSSVRRASPKKDFPSLPSFYGSLVVDEKNSNKVCARQRAENPPELSDLYCIIAGSEKACRRSGEAKSSFSRYVLTLFFLFVTAICGGKCCDKDTEDQLRQQARDDFHGQVRHHSRSLVGLLATTADALRGKCFLFFFYPRRSARRELG